MEAAVMTEMPNSVADAQIKLREQMHGSRNWQERIQSQPSPSKRSKIVARWVVGIIVFGIALGMVAAGRAAERIGPTWQVWVAPPGEEWKPVGDTKNGEVACNLLILKVTKSEPSGTLIACRRTQ